MQFKHLPTLQTSAFKMKSLFTQSWKYFYGILLPFSTKWDRISCSSFILHKYTNRFKLETDLPLKVFVIHDTKKLFSMKRARPSFSEFSFTSFLVWIDADYDCTCNEYKGGNFFVCFSCNTVKTLRWACYRLCTGSKQFSVCYGRYQERRDWERSDGCQWNLVLGCT
jgi:hypothetical protein